MKNRAPGLLSVFFVATCVFAGTRVWLSATGTGDWFDPLNWDGQSTVPDAGDDVVIDTAGTVLLATSTPELASLTLTRGSLMFTNWNTVLHAGNINIDANGVLTLAPAFIEEIFRNRIQIECENFILAEGGVVAISGLGYAGTKRAQGSGPGKGLYNAGGGHGAGHGGVGITSTGVPLYLWGDPYDDPIEPLLPGSSGGGAWNSAGGAGGGAIRILATGSVRVDGAINATGKNGNPSDSSFSGSGSGGSVYIRCETFSGGAAGLIDVSGGGTPMGTDGAGGRIAIHYDSAQQAQLPIPQVVFRAKSGNVMLAHSMGSLYLSDGSWAAPPFTRFQNVWFHGDWANNLEFADDLKPAAGIGFGTPAATITVFGDIVLDNLCMGLSAGSKLICNNLTLTNGGSLSVLSAYVSLPLTAKTTTQYGALVDVANTIHLEPQSWIYPFTFFRPYIGISNTNGVAPLFKAAQIYIAENAGFNADSLGHPGGIYNVNTWGTGSGSGSGRGFGVKGGAGASHGGLGKGAPESKRYGSAFAPVFPGSGGSAGYRGAGGIAGGAIRLEATGVVEMNGVLTANAAPSQSSDDMQGASGGSIFVLAGSFKGGPAAVMRADGGRGSCGDGGGGRIAVGIGLDCDKINELFDPDADPRVAIAENYSAYLGVASVSGCEEAEAGTIQFMTQIPRGAIMLIR